MPPGGGIKTKIMHTPDQVPNSDNNCIYGKTHHKWKCICMVKTHRVSTMTDYGLIWKSNFLLLVSVWAKNNLTKMSDDIIIVVCSCQRAAVGARSGETGWLWCGWSADGHTDQEGNVCGYAVLDGSRGYSAVCLRLQGKTPKTWGQSTTLSYYQCGHISFSVHLLAHMYY